MSPHCVSAVPVAGPTGPMGGGVGCVGGGVGCVGGGVGCVGGGVAASTVKLRAPVTLFFSESDTTTLNV